MDRLLRKKNIYRVEPPPSTIEGWNVKLERDKREWGQYFGNDEEAELFCMLPLNATQRGIIIDTLKRERMEQHELDTCTGRPDSSPDHRMRCISCVLKYKPDLENLCQ